MGVAAGALAAGVLAGAGGAFLGGNAASATKKKLNDIANMPGVNIGSAYNDALGADMLALPQAQDLTGRENTFNNAQQQAALEAAIPGYKDIQGARSANTLALLHGDIPDDVLGQIQRGDTAKALSGGFGNSQAGRNLTARDLGLTSLQLQQQGFNNAGSLVSGTPRPKLETLDDILNIDAKDVLGVRSNERTQSIGAYTNAAVAPGATATWANYLQKQGSQLEGLGGGMMGGGGGGGGGATGGMSF